MGLFGGMKWKLRLGDKVIKRKICMIVDNPVVNDMRVLKEAKSLGSSGYTVHIYCQQSNGLAATEVIGDNVEVRRVYGPHLGTTFYIDKYLEAHFTLMNKITERYDIIHCHDTETWPIGYILSKQQGAHFICDVHEYFPDYILRDTYPSEYRYLLAQNLMQARGQYIRYADKVITVSESLASALQEEFLLEEKPTVIMNSRPRKDYVRVSSRILREKYNIDEKTAIIFYQGKIDESRGLELAIDALPLIDNVKLILAGFGPEEYINRLQARAYDRDCEDKLLFIGFINYKDLIAYTESADILIFTGRACTKNITYCFPNKFFDYLYTSKPIITTQLQEMEKIIKEHRIGETVQENDPKAFATAVNKLVHDQELLSGLRERKQKLIDIFSWENEEEKLINLYQSLTSISNTTQP